MKKKKLVHHHFLYYAIVGRTDMRVEEITRHLLEEFLSSLVIFLQMDHNSRNYIMYDEVNQVRVGKSFTSISHIIFHYFMAQNTVQIDLYSSGAYDKDTLKGLCDFFRQVKKFDFLFINKHSPALALLEA